MRKLILTTVLVAGCAITRPSPVVTGWVSDANCTTAHVGGKNPGCVIKCAKGGAHIGHPEWTPQAIVLVEDKTDRVLVIDNPEKVAGLEAQHVKIHASITGETMHIDTIERD